MKVGEKIKFLRKRHKLTLAELSKKVNLSISFLSDIENSRSNPSLFRLQSIADALETSVSYLMGDYQELGLPDISEAIDNKAKTPSDPLFYDIIYKLKDFDSWSEMDKRELSLYLNAKEEIRKSSSQ